MFENQQPQPNPLNPVMPSPGLPPQGSMPQATPPPAAPPQPSIHTMPERFRASGGGPKSSGGTKKLMIILIVVLVLAGLGFGAMYVFQNVLGKENANTNTTNTTANTDTGNENTNVADENSNANSNVNAATNANDNTNAAVNTNTTSNTNTTNTNGNLNTNTATTVGPLPSSTDSDSDGLTDVEEALFGTDSKKPDTDSDTFVDGKQVQANGTIVGELYLGYNPTGTGALEGSTLVSRQQNSAKDYGLLVPATWTVTNDSSGGMLISPAQQTGEFVQVRINDNPTRLTPKQWYQANNPSSQVDTLTTVAVNGLEGIISEDGSTVYLFKDTKVYSIQYSTGSLSQVNYRTTFEMMYRSFKLVAKT